MFGFFVVVVIMVLGVAIPLAIARQGKINEAWASAARQLDLRFTPGTLGRRREMTGQYRGAKVKIYTYSESHGKSSSTYTRFRVWLPKPLGLGLNLKPEGLFSGITKAFGAQDIETGDQVFDDAVIVKGDRQAKVLEFLTPARRVRIQRFLRASRSARIGDSEVQRTEGGAVASPERLINLLQRMVELAHSLSAERTEDATFERSLEARNQGRIEEALQMLTPLVSSPSPGGERLDERLAEGELLHMSGRADEARQVFEDALATEPEDQELQQWVDEVSAPEELPPEPPPEPPPVPEPAPAPEPAPVEPPPAPTPPADGHDVDSVCAAIFPPDTSSFEAARLFDAQFKDVPVHWSGVLKDVRSYAYDMVFGSDPGSKATLEIGETESTAYGTKKILAILQLPKGADEALRDRIGETLSFHGVLKKADGFMRNIFVAAGRLD